MVLLAEGLRRRTTDGRPSASYQTPYARLTHKSAPVIVLTGEVHPAGMSAPSRSRPSRSNFGRPGEESQPLLLQWFHNNIRLARTSSEITGYHNSWDGDDQEQENAPHKVTVKQADIQNALSNLGSIESVSLEQERPAIGELPYAAEFTVHFINVEDAVKANSTFVSLSIVQWRNIADRSGNLRNQALYSNSSLRDPDRTKSSPVIKWSSFDGRGSVDVSRQPSFDGRGSFDDGAVVPFRHGSSSQQQNQQGQGQGHNHNQSSGSRDGAKSPNVGIALDPSGRVVLDEMASEWRAASTRPGSQAQIRPASTQGQQMRPTSSHSQTMVIRRPTSIIQPPPPPPPALYSAGFQAPASAGFQSSAPASAGFQSSPSSTGFQVPPGPGYAAPPAPVQGYASPGSYQAQPAATYMPSPASYSTPAFSYSTPASNYSLTAASSFTPAPTTALTPAQAYQ
ncbi:hypothetical protein C8J56DRAFT_1100897 [Mycena floridula]|nr:hypothetical protein C8J56DRAFT_1100897 [Mycena floridula]